MSSATHHPFAACATFGSVLIFAASAPAQVLFDEAFDDEASAKVAITETSDTLVEFVDYSNFTLGAVTHSIPEAPNMLPGSTATRGVVMQVNLTENLANLVNLTALENVDGDPAEFSGNFRMTFDMFLGLDPSADRASAGTTHQGVWAIGGDGVVPYGRVNRTDGAIVGTWGWLATDSGYTSEDARMWENGTLLGSRTDAANTVLFEEAFPTGAPIVPAPNNSWVAVEVTSLDGVVTVAFNGVEFFSFPSVSTSGYAVIGYEDPFSSLSFSNDYQFGLFDNWLIEVAVPPTLTVEQTSLFEVVLQEGSSATAGFLATNTGGAAVTISEVNFTGADAAEFALAGALPITVPAGGTTNFDVTFTAGAELGVQTATLGVVSDDAVSPAISLPLEAIYAPLLLAHYPLDETEGTTVFDISGSAANGAYVVRDASLELAQPALAAGTSVRLTAADSSDIGNFAFMRPLHVPTTSISLWVRPEQDASPADTLFNRDPGFTGTDTIYGCLIDDSGAVTFRSGGQINVQSDPGAVNDGETHHIVITHLDEDGFGNSTATRTRLYIDGVMVAENTAPPGFDRYPGSAATTAFHLATQTAAGNGYTGLLDDLQIYAIELDAAQVANMFAVPGATALSGAPPSLAFSDVAYDAGAGQLTMTWNSLPGKLYLLEDTTDYEEWEEIDDSIESEGLSTSYTLGGVDPGSEPERGFRIREQ